MHGMPPQALMLPPQSFLSTCLVSKSNAIACYNPKQQRGSEPIPRDDIHADSVFFDKKCGMHGIRECGTDTERLIPQSTESAIEELVRSQIQPCVILVVLYNNLWKICSLGVQNRVTSIFYTFRTIKQILTKLAKVRNDNRVCTKT